MGRSRSFASTELGRTPIAAKGRAHVGKTTVHSLTMNGNRHWRMANQFTESSQIRR